MSKPAIVPCATIVDHGNLYADIRATDEGFGTFVEGAKLYDEAAIAMAEKVGRRTVGAAFIRACCHANLPYETMLKIQAYMPVDAFDEKTHQIIGAVNEARK